MKSPHSVSLSPLLCFQPILFPVRVTLRICVTASIFRGETRVLAFTGILLTYYHNTIAAEAVFFLWSHKQQKIEKPIGFLYILNISQFLLSIKPFTIIFIIFYCFLHFLFIICIVVYYFSLIFIPFYCIFYLIINTPCCIFNI